MSQTPDMHEYPELTKIGDAYYGMLTGEQINVMLHKLFGVTMDFAVFEELHKPVATVDNCAP